MDKCITKPPLQSLHVRTWIVLAVEQGNGTLSLTQCLCTIDTTHTHNTATKIFTCHNNSFIAYLLYAIANIEKSIGFRHKQNLRSV